MLLLGGEDGIVDEARLRGITSTGVPDAGGLRPVLWRFLLRCVLITVEGIYSLSFPPSAARSAAGGQDYFG